jgi:hypothetical protein
MITKINLSNFWRTESVGKIDVGGINPAIKRHLELEIETLQNPPRDVDKLRRLLQVKQRQKGEAMNIEDTQRLVMEIAMLIVVLYCIVFGIEERKQKWLRHEST